MRRKGKFMVMVGKPEWPSLDTEREKCEDAEMNVN